MKKNTKVILCILLFLVLLLSITAIPAFAEEATMTVTLRIEGIDANMFYKTVEVPYMDTLTLQTALTYIDTQESGITITGVAAAYITDVNGDTAGKFGGWDGWMYKVNGTDSAVGIDGYTLTDGDSVVLYYGDPYGIGMQFPVADTTKIADGVIKFTSADTTYDANYTPTVTVNPVVGATVLWTYGDKTASYTTDENGEIVITAAQLTEGNHSIVISKIAGNGAPLVLRFASDYTVPVTASNSSENEINNSDVPQTGDGGFSVLIILSTIAIFAIIITRRKEVYEK